MAKKSLLYGSLVLSVGAVGAKVIGAVYRILLTNIIGAEGIGLYQLVFPYYVLMLSISTSGLPQAISTLIAIKLKANDNVGGKKIFSVAFRSLLILGLLFSLILAIFSGKIAILLGNSSLKSAFVAIAPSVLLVSLISVYRGYFSAKYDMLPTAVSQIIEQVFKAGLCIVFAYLFMPNVIKAVTFSILSVTISEFIALVYLVVRYKLKQDFTAKVTLEKKEFRRIFFSIYKLAIPFAFSALLLPFSQIIDGILVVKILNSYTNGTSLYGLLTGAVFSIASLPICIAGSVATCTIPKLAGEHNGKKTILTSLNYTLIVSLAMAIGLFLFARLTIQTLYFNLQISDIKVATALLKSYCPSIVLFSLLTTTVAILLAKKKSFLPCISMLIAVLVKITLNYLLMPLPSLNIFATIISQTVCFSIALLLNLIFIFRIRNQ